MWPRAGSCDVEADVFLRLGRRPGLVQFIGMRPDEQLLLTEFAPHGSLSELLADDEKAEQLTMEHKMCMLHQVRYESNYCMGWILLLGLILDYTCHRLLLVWRHGGVGPPRSGGAQRFGV